MTLEDLRFYQRYYYGLNQRMLKIIGLWPAQEPRWQFFLHTIVNLFFLSGFLFEAYQFYHMEFNLEKVIDHLQLCIPAACSCISYNVGIVDPTIIPKVYNRINYDIIMMVDEQEIMLLRKYSANIRTLSWLIASSLFAYYLFLLLPVILTFSMHFNDILNNTSIVFLIPTEDIIDTKMNYYGMLLYQVLLAFVVIIVMAATYSSYVAAIQHACLLLSIVIFKIKAPFDEDQYENRYLRFDVPNVGYDWITNIVRSYISAVEFVKLINMMSETIYLAEVVGAVFILILCFLYLSDMYFAETKNIQEIGKCAIYSGTTIFLVYVNCHFGQMLINFNAVVLREFRQIPFYKISIKAQKLLPLVILRCMQPCALMIGGIFVSSHEFFSSLLHTSLSYAMVCHTMR